MSLSRSTTTLALVGVYMLVCIGIGLWAAARTKSSQDFFVAGKSLGVAVTTLALFSTTLSGFGFVGGPGLVYRMGTGSFWIMISVPLGYAVAFFLLAKRLRLFAELDGSLSIPDVLAARYRSETTRVLSAVAIVLGVMGYMATQILAMATVLQDLLHESGVWSHASLTACALLSTAVLVFYCVTGGILASVYTDVVQGSIMVGAALLIFVTAAKSFDGGFAGMSEALWQDNPASIGPWGSLGIVGCVSWYFVFGIGLCGQPHIVSKFMMNRRVSDARSILPLTVLAYVLASSLWVGIGLCMRAKVVTGAHPPLVMADAAASAFLQHYAHPVLSGIVFAGLFAAIMSTADAFLNIGAAALVHDLYRAFRGRSMRRELLGARLATIAIAVLAVSFALYSHYQNERLVALLGVFGWTTFAAALVPALAIGLNWKRATAPAANAAIVVSLILNLALEISGLLPPMGLQTSAFVLLTSVAVFIAVSLRTTPPRHEAQVAAALRL